jgi:hypothetical protein
MNHLTETDRSINGGRYDDKSINAHSVRTFHDGHGRTYMLSRELDEEGRPYRAFGPIPKDFVGILPLFKVAGADEFGESRSWKTAIQSLDEAVGAYNDLLKTKDQIVRFDPTGDTQRIVSDGLSGTCVEMWFVPQDVVDRGTWGNDIKVPGWCWQKMDAQEIHGPFETDQAALDDYHATREHIDDGAPTPSMAR